MLMKKVNYPELEMHKEVHKVLTKQVTDLQDKFLDGKKLISLEVLNFLKGWLLNHVEGTDKKYSSYIL